MNKQIIVKTGLTTFGLLLFFSVAALLIFYAMGYRIDIRNQEIKKIGIIAVDSEPREATVFLERQKQKKTTPLDFYDLDPGTYQVDVSRKGYIGWQKKVKVESEKVSRLFAYLLLENPLTTVLNKNVTSLKYSPDQSKIAYIDSKQKTIFAVEASNLTPKKILGLQFVDNKIAYTVSNYVWTNDNENLLLETTDKSGAKTIFYTTTNYFGRPLKTTLKELPQKSYLSDRTLIFLGNSNLSVLSNNKSTTILKKCVDFTLKDKTIYALTSAKGTTNLNLYSHNNGYQKVENTFTINKTLKSVVFLTNRLLLTDNQNELLEYSTADKNYETLYPKAVFTLAWDDKTILTSNGHEIQLLNMETKEAVLVTRLTTPIQKIAIINPHYLIIETDNNTIAIAPDGQNNTMLNNNSANEFLLCNGKNALLFLNKETLSTWQIH